MDREEVLDVRNGLGLAGGALSECVQDGSALVVEGPANLEQFFVRAQLFELTGHNFEGGYRLHVVAHVEVTALGFVSLFSLQGVEGRRVGDEEQIGIILGVHGLISKPLEVNEEAEADVGFHHVGEFIPDEKDAVELGCLGEFILDIKEPVAEFLRFETDVDASIAQHILHFGEGAGVLGLQIGDELVGCGGEGR